MINYQGIVNMSTHVGPLKMVDRQLVRRFIANTGKLTPPQVDELMRLATDYGYEFLEHAVALAKALNLPRGEKPL